MLILTMLKEGYNPFSKCGGRLVQQALRKPGRLEIAGSGGASYQVLVPRLCFFHSLLPDLSRQQIRLIYLVNCF